MGRSGLLGLMMAVTAIATVAIAVILIATSSSETTIVDLLPGTCFDLDADGDEGELDAVDTTSCDEPHEAEAVAVGDLNPDGGRPYPDDDELFATIEERCAGALDDDRFGLVPVAPTRATWESQRGRYVCVAIPFGGGTTVGSITAG